MTEEVAQLVTEAREMLARLEPLVPARSAGVDFSTTMAASWHRGPLGGSLRSRGATDALVLDDLLGIDRQKERVHRNTVQFVRGLPANNVLLWGARGTGKSSLVHALLNRHAEEGLRVVEVERDAVESLPEVVDLLAREPWRFIVFCDDLSFEAGDASFKALKSVLDGSMFTTADNVLIYATSNRRHLLPEFQSENQEFVHLDTGEVHPGETTEEKVSLSDRFGLWVSFQPFPQAQYLDVACHWVEVLSARHGIALPFDDECRAEALRWSLTRGARSGRVANHFARHWVGTRLLDPPHS